MVRYGWEICEGKKKGRVKGRKKEGGRRVRYGREEGRKGKGMRGEQGIGDKEEYQRCFELRMRGGRKK